MRALRSLLHHSSMRLGLALLAMSAFTDSARADVIFALQPAHDARCLEGEANARTNGGQVWTWSCSWAPNQQWSLVKAEGSTNTFSIKSVNSGLCLDVGGGGGTANGTFIVQWACNGLANQQFSAVALGRGWYRFVARNSGRCLDVAGASRANGSRVWQWDCQNTSSQYWYAIPLN